MRGRDQAPVTALPPSIGATFRQLLRFGVVGCLNTVIDLLALNALFWLFPTRNIGLLLVENSLAYSVGAVNSFLLNKYWTFRFAGRARQREVGRFALTTLAGVACNNLLLWLMGTLLHPVFVSAVLWANAAKLVAIGGSVLISYLGMRLWVFVRPAPAPRAAANPAAANGRPLWLNLFSLPKGAAAMSAAASLRVGIITRFRRADLAPAVFIIAGLSFLAHVLVGNNYGYFRDELYVMAMSQHPAFGYTDVPPLVPWITLIPRFLTGNALWAIHIISALVCAGTIILTGLMARLLGGARWVQGLAALGSATALILMAIGSVYAYDVFDEFWWTLAATILILLLRDERPRRWLVFGLVAGLGLLTKETILFWGVALVVGLLLTPQRRLLFTRWTLFGGLIAFALVLPFLLWNAFNEWASFQYWAGYSHNQLGGGTPLDFILGQIGGMNPLSVLLWGAGLWYFFSARAARYRAFGWAYLILLVLFAAMQAKAYFLAPAYPPLYAGGALVMGGWRVRWRRWVAVYPVLLVLSAVLLAPAVMPVLPPAVYAQVYGKNGSAGAGDSYGLPQSLADRFGWEQQVALIAQVYHSLPPDEQRVACIFTENYGEASALLQFGGRYHLPLPISGHNAFYLWGPQGCTGQVLITINIDPQDAAQGFNSVTLAARTSCAACVNFENNAPILILRQPKMPFAALWAQAKHYD
jgi:putative flippase GtrA